MADSTSPKALFETWQDVLQQHSTFWAEATAMSQAPDPARQAQQLCALWAESWSNIFAQEPSSELFRKAQKMWTEQLETVAQGLNKVMGTEAFAAMQNQHVARQLVWQQQLAQAANPQLDLGLRALNLPSREQIDRLFARVIGMEERLDDLDDTLQQILQRLCDQDPPPVTADV